MRLVNNKKLVTSGVILAWGLFCLIPSVLIAQPFRSGYELKAHNVIQHAPISALADSSVKADSIRLPEPQWQGMVSPFPGKRSGLIQLRIPEDNIVVQRDSSGNYVVQREILGIPASIPRRYSFDQYKALSLKDKLHQNWVNIVNESNLKRDIHQGLLDFKINIPGGKKSAFTTIFGKPEVNLRVTGTANMNVGASIQKTADPSLPPSQQKRVDPTFNQNLKLNIKGTIGDKLNIMTDWDTERPFDYQNRLKILYQGYDDEILKSIELGNVSMETGNSLIRGGNALFGLKSVAKMGPLKITSVLSQQQGKNNSQTITGGSQEQSIDIRPADYENSRDFYLDFYAWNHFEEAVANPQTTISLFNFSNIRIYKLDIGNENVTNPQTGVAIAGLGARKSGDTYQPPDQRYDNFDDNILNQVRNSKIDTIDVANLAKRLGLKNDRDIVKGTWIELQPGKDYTMNQGLGLVFLKTSLLPNEALAVAYDYSASGEQHSVGDVQSLGPSTVQILQLVRQPNQTSDYTTWPLTMRNVYALGPTNLTQDGLDVGVYYTGTNTDSQTLPNFNTTLLTDLGLDRVNQDGQTVPDNQIDFIPPIMDAVNGKIIFPYRQPFGSHIVNLINNNKSVPNKQDAINNLAFTSLYSEPQEIANQESQNNIYEIKGKAKGGASDTYNLGVALVEGSVKVFSNGVQLTEGVDYTVDYSIGNIIITNKKYLAPGQQIKIEYESNQILQIQQTSFTGVRAQYDLSNNIEFGGTFFKLKDKPLTDKIRIGDEPINNSVLGLDAKAKFDAPWLTRVVDHIPLLQTKAPSSISFSGEWAQLRPGVAQTNAVQSAIRKGELKPDEKKGLSFIDDFEGSKTSFSFLNPGHWHLAAAPAAVPGYDLDMNHPSESLEDKINRSDLRAQFSWYMLPINISSLLGIQRGRATAKVKVTDVFPQRQTLPQQNTIQPLDIYYNPTKRGPYNYNPALKNILDNEPQKMWGGITAALPNGLENLTLNNIEFVEFWVQPVLPKEYRKDGNNQPNNVVQDYDGKIFLDVGTVSEDVIPNFTSNNEDALSQLGSSGLVIGQSDRSYVLNAQATYDGQFSTKSLKQEDVGLDGVPDKGGYGGVKNEQTLFADWLNKMKAEFGINSPTYKKMAADPSDDDYDYFAEQKLRQEYGTSSIQPYFYRMYGYYEGNSEPPSGDKRAITNRPDAEGLKIPSVPNYRDSYYEYQINMNPANKSSLKTGNDYIVDKVEDGSHPGDYWYQVRIPLSDFKRAIGDIKDLQNVSHIRIWMTGYKKPFTLRFAKFELVGSQWRKAQKVGDQASTNTSFQVSTVNIEENSTRSPIPYRQPPGSIRPINRTQQGNILANEQSLSLKVNDLRQGDMRMIRRNYPGGLNLLNYSHLRMFVHGEGYKQRNNLELVMRFGRDLQNDYYEYRQPITPTDSTLFAGKISTHSQEELDRQANEVWLPDQNSVNLVLSALNQLKQLRNQENGDLSTLFQDSTLAEELGAPKGTVIGVKGNPSLDKITEIGIGIKNPSNLAPDGNMIPSNKGVPSLDATLWVDELRVSGYNNKKGWAADANMHMKMADFAQVDASYNRSTDGFGSLDSHLSQRQFADKSQYNVNTTVNLNKLIPDRYGWNFPVSFSARRSVSTPRYLPQEGDIRLSDFKNAVKRRNISQSEKDQLIQQKITESQNYNQSYSINVSNISKKYSKSKVAKSTLDHTTLNYVYNAGNSHDPSTLFNDYWNYNTGIRYSYNFNKVGLVRPFGFMQNVPILNVLSGLRFGYMPSSVSASAGLKRNYQESRQRSFGGGPQPPKQTHDFDYSSQFGLSYNFMPSIPISFSTSTNFKLTDIATRPDPTDSTRFIPKSTFDVLKSIVTDKNMKPRRTSYNEKYSTSWRPRLNKTKLLNWMSYSASYSGGFTWQNSPKGSGLGADINNNLSLDQSMGLKTSDLLMKIPLYRNLKEADRQATQKRKEEKARQKAEEKRREKEQQNGNSKSEGVRKNEDNEKGNLFDDVKFYGRKLLLSVFSMQSIDISYNHNGSAAQRGYNGGSQFFQMFNSPGSGNFSPPMSYRLGITDQLDNIIQNPYSDQVLTLSVNRTASDQVTIRTRLNPFPNFTIDLNWTTNWNSNRNQNFNLQPGSIEKTGLLRNQSGNIGSSVWAFGKGYQNLLSSQIKTAEADINPNNPNLISDKTGNQDGRTVLSPGSLTEDFRKAYLGANAGSVGKLGFTPIPKPNWSVRWSGLENKIPIIGKYASHISLTHQYQGTYQIGWNFFNDAGSIVDGNLGNYTVQSIRDPYEATAVNITKKFTPVVGLNITWKNNVGTNLEYDYSKITSLSFTGPTVEDRISKGFKLTMNYTKRGFRLPFLFKRLKNTMDLSFTLNYLEDITIPYKLGIDLSRALEGGELLNNNTDIRGDARLQASTIIGYQFSSTLKANFEYSYRHTMPKSSQSFEMTDQEIKFNIIVSIKSN
ncbi:MAG TPA: cell surface protein SprA [Balneolales bacterium]|nr:cell surface protein SprA [Balneolales bacterium]